MWQLDGNKFDFSMTENIDAPRDVVYSVLSDFETYPDFITDIISVSPTSTGYHMVVKAAILTVPADVRVRRVPGREIAFELTDGPIDVLTGRWLIDGGEDGQAADVTLSVHMEAGQRSEWLLRMAGTFVQNKTGKLADAFRERIEMVSRGEVPAAVPQPAYVALLLWLRQLWERLTGKQPAAVVSRAADVNLSEPHQLETLEALAGTVIPPDDFDGGAAGLGFAEVANLRARYTPGRADIYQIGVRAVDQVAADLFGVERFAALSLAQRTELLEAIREERVAQSAWGNITPGKFFGALAEDVVFLYCTHPDTWQRLGWPGPSFDQGGYPDFDQKPETMG